MLAVRAGFGEVSVTVRATRGWRPDPLSDSDVVDLADSGESRWELTPPQDHADARAQVSRAAASVSVSNLAAIDVGMMCLFLLFSVPGTTGATSSAPRGNWSDLSAVSYYLGEFVDLVRAGMATALTNPVPLLVFGVIMVGQLVSVGLIRPSDEGSPNTG